MGTYINLYTNNPTAGEKDGTAVSEDAAQTSPIAFLLTIKDSAAQTAVKCAVRCESGYRTSGETLIKPYFYNEADGSYSETGGNVDMFSLASDENFTDEAAALTGGTWENALTITDTITETNRIFWVKVSAAEGTKPQKIKNTVLHYEATIEAV